jgi:hypothetical protein
MHIPQAIDRDNMVIDPTTYMEYCTKLIIVKRGLESQIIRKYLGGSKPKAYMCLTKIDLSINELHYLVI